MTKPLTVKELMDLLKDLPEDLRVDIEGCDCIGNAIGIDVDVADQSVLITRN